METLSKIEATKDELFRLYEEYIKEQISPIFKNNPALKYFHYARHTKERYLSLNGIRWEDIDYFIHAVDFEKDRRDNNASIIFTINETLQEMPDFKALRLAAEDIYRVLADLTTQGVFSIFLKGVYGIRLIATKDAVSYRELQKEEIDYYPSPHSDDN